MIIFEERHEKNKKSPSRPVVKNVHTLAGFGHNMRSLELAADEAIVVFFGRHGSPKP